MGFVKKISPLASVGLFNLALICGIIISQIVNLESIKEWIFFAADTLLAYIMMEVGLEFYIKKKKWKQYLIDYGVASLAAGLPWLFCFLYFLKFRSGSWEESLLLARFSAPTATGILFAMLGLAGLGMTWMFKKIEVLVILDDLDTVLFLIPLQLLLSGGEFGLISVAVVMFVLIFLGWRFMHKLKLPSGRLWLFLYSITISGIAEWLHVDHMLEVEVLLPAFILGLTLYNPSRIKHANPHKHEFLEPQSRVGLITDRTIKLLFMFLVGLLLPKITIEAATLKSLLLHIVCITVLMNLGKLAPIFFYRKEASFKERLAVAVGMMPRGEMGAGILTIALGHGIKDIMTQAATLSLALNLFLTGFFIWVIINLIKPVKQ